MREIFHNLNETEGNSIIIPFFHATRHSNWSISLLNNNKNENKYEESFHSFAGAISGTLFPLRILR
jgi:hypothetical protein